VLVAVLVLTCLLTVLVGRLAVSTMSDLEFARTRADVVRARNALESGLALAQALLTEHRTEFEVDSLDDAWREGSLQFPCAGAVVTMSIEDEESRLPVRPLLVVHKPEDAREFNKGLLHFLQRASTDLGLDGDDVRRWLVANQFLLDVPSGMADGPLFEVPAGPTALPAMLFSAWTDGAVNVNTASRECLAFLWGPESSPLVEAVLARREREPFLRAEEVFALPGGGRSLRLPQGVRLTTASDVFRVRLQAEAGAVHTCMEAVVLRLPEGMRVVFRRLMPTVALPGRPKRLDPFTLDVAVRPARRPDALANRAPYRDPAWL
jgi:type II secretory pathway component PulK